MKLYLFTKSWIVLCILIQLFNCLAQGEYNNWYFGDSAGITFNGGTPVSLSDGRLHSWEGCSSISDNTGNLLFYSNGVNVWNKNHLIMPNGTGLMGHISSTQSALIVPQPGNTSIYYLFTTDANEEEGRNGLRYSIIDMTLQGGLGDVTIKNTLLLAPVGEHLTACRNASGCAFWVVSQKRVTDVFYAYLLSSSGLDTIPVISKIGNIALDYGSLKISRQGTKMARGRDLFDFNNATGKVSNYVSLGADYFYSVEFSPSGNLVYGSTFDSLYQFNLLAGSGTPADILASKVGIGGGDIGQLQLGPDDKIYVVNRDTYSLNVIDQPDNVGVGCNYLTPGVSLSGSCRVGLPNFPVNLPVTVVSFSCLNPYYAECFGDTITFKSTSQDTVFQWNFGDTASGISNISSLRNPKHLFSSTGTYSITLISGTGTTADTIIKSIVIQPNPTVNLGETLTITYGTGITITNTESGTYQYQWTPVTGLSCTDCASPFANPTITTTYYTTVTNAGKCDVSDSVTIVVYICGDVFIPSAFSPNNDGYNDVFYAQIRCAKSMDFKIYNRWGEKVFEATKATEGWDGMHKNEPMNSAIFVYYLEAVLENGKAISKKGNITLVK